jgi:hypothetical protein
MLVTQDPTRTAGRRLCALFVLFCSVLAISRCCEASGGKQEFGATNDVLYLAREARPFYGMQKSACQSASRHERRIL